jgi:hypothetical protein
MECYRIGGDINRCGGMCECDFVHVAVCKVERLYLTGRATLSYIILGSSRREC